ncbi:hypothetical protein VOLCADRAFT_98029 [Volvox carteri f. nagariensis]|uniref:Tudor domain-containing protein n=1 Tax=Volvox carteri f. nagariensis TaxID=3068 RepID=D8UE94_VOLCA|nr:uncharacterized protein VOLCADRAFT_98029 [Volvox carteri f. nagariensis]EFJ41928.1 hypothetical protein VOLCADRAFT_98029 [Volvox carteri f. nagariensis]|eukprot:XP_002956965.1 hypothetical protein VOLCADRAFT_98029 [Volvox carteri f. nagariensis]
MAEDIESELEAQLVSQRETLAGINEAVNLGGDSAEEGHAELLQMRDELTAAVSELESALLEIKRARILQQLAARNPPSVNTRNTLDAGPTAPPPPPPQAILPAKAGQTIPSAAASQPIPGSYCHFRYMDGRWYAGRVQGPGRQAHTVSVAFEIPTRPFMLDPVDVMEALPQGPGGGGAGGGGGGEVVVPLALVTQHAHVTAPEEAGGSGDGGAARDNAGSGDGDGGSSSSSSVSGLLRHGTGVAESSEDDGDFDSEHEAGWPPPRVPWTTLSSSWLIGRGTVGGWLPDCWFEWAMCGGRGWGAESHLRAAAWDYGSQGLMSAPEVLLLPERKGLGAVDRDRVRRVGGGGGGGSGNLQGGVDKRRSRRGGVRQKRKRAILAASAARDEAREVEEGVPGGGGLFDFINSSLGDSSAAARTRKAQVALLPGMPGGDGGDGAGAVHQRAGAAAIAGAVAAASVGLVRRPVDRRGLMSHHDNVAGIQTKLSRLQEMLGRHKDNRGLRTQIEAQIRAVQSSCKGRIRFRPALSLVLDSEYCDPKSAPQASNRPRFPFSDCLSLCRVFPAAPNTRCVLLCLHVGSFCDSLLESAESAIWSVLACGQGELAAAQAATARVSKAIHDKDAQKKWLKF